MHDNNHEHIIILIPAYALGILDTAEAGMVARHLKTCPACRMEWTAYESVVGMLSLAAVEIQPTAALKQRLMTRIRAGSTAATAVPTPPSQRQTITGRIHNLLAGAYWQPALALAVLMILLGVFFIRPQVDPILPKRVELAATDVAPNASGFIEMSGNGRDAVLAVAGLPPLSPEQEYQLWLIEGEQRLSGAVFSVHADGAATVPIDSVRPLTEYGAFGITIEPAGGSPAPTGARVLGHNLPEV